MSGEFLGESVVDLAIEGTRGTIMLKDFDDTLLNIVICDHVLFEILCADSLDKRMLAAFLALIEVGRLVVNKLLYQLSKVFTNPVEHYQPSCFPHVAVRTNRRPFPHLE